MKIGERLRRAMERAGLTQKRLSQLTAIDEGTISALMRGETENPEWLTVEKLVHAIGTTWGELFNESPLHLSIKDTALAHEFDDFLHRLLANVTTQRELSRPKMPPPMPRRQQKQLEIRDTPDRGGDEVELLPDEPVPEEYVRRGARRPYRVIADVMLRAGIMEGAVIFARPSVDLEAADGKIAVVRLNGKLLLKRIDRSGKQTVLTSENQRYAEIFVTKNDIFELVAVVEG